MKRNRIPKLIVLAAALLFVFGPGLVLLAGCAADRPEPVVTIQKETVAVATRCTPDIGKSPEYPDSAEALKAVPHPDAVARLKANSGDIRALIDQLENLGYTARLLLKGRLARIQREAEILAAFKACQ